MGSKTYLINMHAGSVFFITAGLIAAVLILVFGLYLLIGKKLNLPGGIAKPLMLFAFFAGFALILIATSTWKSRSDMGGIRKFYVLKTDTGRKLAVWCTRIHSKRVGADYEQFIRTFDLMSGAMHGSVRLAEKHYDDDFRLYWSGGHMAWGYQKKTGLQRIDLTKPAIIANNEDFRKQIKVLSSGFTFEAFRYAAEPGRTGLYVKSAAGRLYQLIDERSAGQVADMPVGVDLKREWAFAADWYFYPLKNSMAKHAHNRNANCDTEKSAVLLNPEYLPELNHGFTQKKKAWVVHQSALMGERDLLLSYMGGSGISYNTVNVSRHFPEDDLSVLGTYSLDERILIFVTAGKTFRSGISGFTLSALVTDPETGALSATIKYF